MQLNYGCGKEYPSIFMNSVQGKKLTCCIDNSIDTHHILLFLISKQTHLLGKVLQREFHDCDFIVVKVEAPFDQEMHHEGLKDLALSREVQSSQKSASTFISEERELHFKEEKNALENEILLQKEEVKNL